LKIGVASTCLWKLKPEEIVRFAAENGIYSIEFWIDHLQLFENSSKKYYEGIREDLGKYGVRATVHSISWDINLCSFSKDVRDFSLKEVIKSIDIAEIIGADLIVVHPGRMSFERSGKESFLKMLVEVFSEIYKHTWKKGIKLCIENMEPLKKELLVTWQDFHDFCSRIGIDEIYITMDVAHLGSYRKVRDFYSNLSNKIMHIHISDLTNRQMHLPLGKGKLPIKRILNLLKSYNGIYNIEFFNYSSEFNFGLQKSKINNNEVIDSVKILKKITYKLKRNTK